MDRSIGGLESAGEWHILKTMLPDFKEKRVLDIGCGFGWHCRYASNEGAKSVLGIDISSKMLEKAKSITKEENIHYNCMAIEDMNFNQNQFDVVVSSLVFHYVKDFNSVCEKIYDYLEEDGEFIFSVEHPIFTSRDSQDWHYDNEGEIQHWPIDNYQYEGIRSTKFLEEDVTKYHRTLESYVNTLISNGFMITKISEPIPPKYMVEENTYLKNEFRRPMFLMISSRKKKDAI